MRVLNSWKTHYIWSSARYIPEWLRIFKTVFKISRYFYWITPWMYFVRQCLVCVGCCALSCITFTCALPASSWSNASQRNTLLAPQRHLQNKSSYQIHLTVLFQRCRDKSLFCPFGASDSCSKAAYRGVSQWHQQRSAGVGRPQQSLECCSLWCLFLTGNCSNKMIVMLDSILPFACHWYWPVFNTPQPQLTRVAGFTRVKNSITLVSL